MVKSLEVEFGAITDDNIEQVCQRFASISALKATGSVLQSRAFLTDVPIIIL
jgi:hypothetical protein